MQQIAELKKPYDLDTPLFKLTIGEFLDVFGIQKPATIPETRNFSEPNKYAYGLAGLCELIKCSHPTAQRLKDSGKIPYIQSGRKLVFDKEAVLAALENKKGASK